MRERPYDLIAFIIANIVALIYVAENYVIRCREDSSNCVEIEKLVHLLK